MDILFLVKGENCCNQLILLYEYTCSVGFDIVKETINADEDSTLDDPAFGFNYTSPGADRYKINLVPPEHRWIW